MLVSWKLHWNLSYWEGWEGKEPREEALFAPAGCSLNSGGGREEPPAPFPLSGKEHENNPRDLLHFAPSLLPSPGLSPADPHVPSWRPILTATPVPLLLLGLVPPDLKCLSKK